MQHLEQPLGELVGTVVLSALVARKYGGLGPQEPRRAERAAMGELTPDLEPAAGTRRQPAIFRAAMSSR